jgi:hypothetical protein
LIDAIPQATLEELTAALSKLSTKNAHGLDGIPNVFLKTLAFNDNNMPPHTS